eukprot:SAG31_NODE_24527_length_479_cov_1.342105_1_plen_50_part_10
MHQHTAHIQCFCDLSRTKPFCEGPPDHGQFTAFDAFDAFDTWPSRYYASL